VTEVGRRPDLTDLIAILDAITAIEADAFALDPKSRTFRVFLTFDRELMTAVPDWSEGQPKPSWLIEGIKENLNAWRVQMIREAQWVSKEEQMGSAIDTLMAHYAEELKKAQKAAPQNVVTRMQARVAADTILRLKELKERREAGGVYSQTESRREKARKAWAEEEFEGPKREEQQRRQHQQYDYARRYTYGFDGVDPELRRKVEEVFREFSEGLFGDAFRYGNGTHRAKAPPPPKTPGKTPWYTTLGVAANATKDEIKKAHRRLAARFHPDRYTKPDGHGKMTEINTARDEGLGGL